MTVIVRGKKDSLKELSNSLETFIPLIRSQGDTDAAIDLLKILDDLKKITSVDSPDLRPTLKALVNTFEGEHELMAYTHQRKNAGDWTEADELSLVSLRVLNLTRQMLR